MAQAGNDDTTADDERDEIRPKLDYCETLVKPRVLEEGGGRDIIFRCRAGTGAAPLPPIEHVVWLYEHPLGNATVMWAEGTMYPSLELWQYTEDGPKLLLYFDGGDYGVPGLYLDGFYE